MTGADFIAAAETISRLPGEAAQRSAVSRAYFGAFHVVREWLLALGFDVRRNESSHAVMSRWLLGCGHADAITTGRLLIDLRSDRNHADYDLDESRFGAISFAQQGLARASRIVANISACNHEAVRSQVLTGIQDYIDRTTLARP